MWQHAKISTSFNRASKSSERSASTGADDKPESALLTGRCDGLVGYWFALGQRTLTLEEIG